MAYKSDGIPGIPLKAGLVVQDVLGMGGKLRAQGSGLKVQEGARV